MGCAPMKWNMHRTTQNDDDDRDEEFFGIPVERLSPRGRVLAGLGVAVPIALSALFLLTMAPGFWWLLMIYGWSIFPAINLTAGGLAELGTTPQSVSSPQEREVLEALRNNGWMSAVDLALATTLTVDQANQELERLASAGHIDFRFHDGAVRYGIPSVVTAGNQTPEIGAST